MTPLELYEQKPPREQWRIARQVGLQEPSVREILQGRPTAGWLLRSLARELGVDVQEIVRLQREDHEDR